MKITKEQLRKIIQEELVNESFHPADFFIRDGATLISPKGTKVEIRDFFYRNDTK